MNASPLLLETYFYKEISVKWHSGIESKDEKIIADDLQVNVREIQDPETPRKWIFELTIEFPESPSQKLPLTFRVILVGFFEVVDTYSAELADKLAKANGPALLFSAAREVLASLTSRTFGSTVLLPSVNFLPPAKQSAASRPEPKAKTPPKSKAVKRTKTTTKKSK